MPNEFIIKNGYFSQGNSEISGSLNISGSTTSTQIGVGAVPSGSVRLDVRAQGALSTDVPFRVQNSANSANLLALQGNGNIRIGTDVTTTFKLDVNGFVRVGGGAGTAGQLQIVSGTGQYYPTLTWVNNGSATQGQIAGYGGGLYTQNTGYFQFTSINNVTVGGAYGGRDASALFQVNGTTKGSIPWPRMTAAQRTAITSPVLGLTVYQTDGIAGIYINTSTGWALNTLSPFPYTGSAQITGSLIVTGSITSTSGITGSLQGTSSWANNATTASYATTSQLTNNAYFAQGILSADQSIPPTTDEIIQFVDQYDPQGWYDASTYQFLPNVEGYYTISLGVLFDNPGDNNVLLNVQMRVNGNQEMIIQQPSRSTFGTSLFGTKIVYLNGSGDYIDFTAYQGTGGNINILQGNSAGSGTWFSATYMTM